MDEKMRETAAEELETAEDKTVTELKNLLSRKNAEAAAYKKRLHEKMNEQERKENELYRKRDREATYRAALLDAGFGKDAAEALSKSLPEGIPPEFFAEQKRFLEKRENEIRGEFLKGQPGLTRGSTPSGDPAARETELLRKAAGLRG